MSVHTQLGANTMGSTLPGWMGSIACSIANVFTTCFVEHLFHLSCFVCLPFSPSCLHPSRSPSLKNSPTTQRFGVAQSCSWHNWIADWQRVPSGSRWKDTPRWYVRSPVPLSSNLWSFSSCLMIFSGVLLAISRRVLTNCLLIAIHCSSSTQRWQQQDCYETSSSFKSGFLSNCMHEARSWKFTISFSKLKKWHGYERMNGLVWLPNSKVDGISNNNNIINTYSYTNKK